MITVNVKWITIVGGIFLFVSAIMCLLLAIDAFSTNNSQSSAILVIACGSAVGMIIFGFILMQRLEHFILKKIDRISSPASDKPKYD